MIFYGGLLAGDDRPILVVDDDDGIRAALEAALAAEGYAVLTATDGLAALEIARANVVALIILDVRMPGMDGAQFSAAYAELPGPHARTILLSAYEDRHFWLDAIRARAFLSKPFDLGELLALVGEHYGRPN